MATQKKVPQPTVEPRKKRRVIVEFTDGRVEQFPPNNPRLLMAFEAEHGHTNPKGIQEVCWLAWHKLGRPGDLEGFIDSVEEIDLVEVEAGKENS